MPVSTQPFLQLVISRAFKALEHFDQRVWRDLAVLPAEGLAPTREPLPLAEARKLPLTPLRFPHSWGRLHQFRWVRVVVPPTTDSTPRWLTWVDTVQSLAWLGDKPYWGFDKNHRRVPVPAEGGEFWLEGVCVTSMNNAWTPLPAEGSCCDGARLLVRDDRAWWCQHALELLYQLAISERNQLHPDLGDGPRWIGYQHVIDIAPPLYRRVLRALDRAVTALHAEGIEGLERELRAAYASLRGDPNFGLACTLVGHAHIDLVWLWPERVGELKTRHSLATVDRLMDLYPEFRMIHTQPAAWRTVERDAPALWSALRQRAKEGKLDTLGAMEVESDTLIACGEALARSFQLGQDYGKKLSGEISRLLWLPDVFGYSACLPQLMRAHGVKYFFTTKLSWNILNRFPYSSFIWRGSDGSEVLAHLTQEIGYNGNVSVKEVRSGAESYRQSDVHGEFLFPTGYGDGGGGVTLEMCERARLAADLAGVPPTRWDTATAFFERLAQKRAELPAYEGELYFEYHRGTYTTHGDIKALFRGTERALQIQEAAHAALGLGPVPEAPWRRLVFAQFHDYIPGSSIPPVYAEARAELGSLVAGLAEDVAGKLGAASGAEALFNPLPQERLHALPDGEVLRLPPLAGTPVASAPRAGVARAVASEHRLANGIVAVEFDANGDLVQFVVDGRPVGLSGGAGLWLYTDVPAQFPSWDLDRSALDTGRPVATPVVLKTATLADGSATFEVTRQVTENSRATLTYRLRAGADTLECELALDWRDAEKLLKYRLPTLHQGAFARFGAPYGSVLRPQKPGDPRAEAMWEVPASRWAVVQDDAGAEGAFIVTEAKYGFGCRDGVLDVSLVRSPMHTGMEGEEHNWIYPAAARDYPFMDRHTDQGRHVIRFALGRYAPDSPRASQPAALADSLYTPPVAYRGGACHAGLLGVDGSVSLVAAWAQPLETGAWLLRLHETLGRRGEARVRVASGWTARVCGFRGEDRGGSVAEGGELVVAHRPYEIVTVAFRRQA